MRDAFYLRNRYADVFFRKKCSYAREVKVLHNWKKTLTWMIFTDYINYYTRNFIFKV